MKVIVEMLTSKSAASLICVALLAACGGGGTSTKGAIPIESYDTTFAGLFGLTNRAKPENSELTASNQVPTSGSAQYDGYVGVLLDDSTADGLVGSARLIVDFQNRKFAGTAGNFYSVDEKEADGKLNFSDGVISRGTVTTLQVNIVGSVDFRAGQLEIDVAGNGNFREGNANIMAIIADGSSTSGGKNIRTLVSTVAERQ